MAMTCHRRRRCCGSTRGQRVVCSRFSARAVVKARVSGRLPAQVRGDGERDQRHDVEEPPVERGEGHQEQQPGHRAVSEPGDDPERRQPRAAAIRPELLRDDEVGERGLGGEEDARDHLQGHEGDEAPGEGRRPGGEGEQRQRQDEQRPPPPAVGQPQQRHAPEGGEADQRDADREGRDRDPQPSGDDGRRQGQQGHVVDLEEAGHGERAQNRPLAPVEVHQGPDDPHPLLDVADPIGRRPHRLEGPARR